MDIMEESSTPAPAVDVNARQPSNQTTSSSSSSADANSFGGQPGFSTELNWHATQLDDSRSPTAYPTQDHAAALLQYQMAQEVSSQQSIQGTFWPSTSFASSHSGSSLGGPPRLDDRGDRIAPAQLKTPWTPRTTIDAEGASASSTDLEPRRLTESTAYDVDGSAAASADGSGTYDGNAPSSDTTTPGKDKRQLRRLVDTIDATLKHTRQNSPNDTNELVSLSHRLVLALDQLMEVEDDVSCTLLYHHILVQSRWYIEWSDADDTVKLECAGFEADANRRLEKLAGSFEYTEIMASNIAVSIIDRGKEIFGSDRSKLGPIQACVYDILHHINDCITNGVDAETFKQGHLRYRHALGVAFKDRTGKTPNLGDGLSEFITLIVVMNFATPECESYACPSGDEFSKMDLGNSCVSAWHKSFPTLIEKDTGILTSSHRGTDGGVKDIGFIDRLCFISESNKSKNGEVQDMSEVLKEGCIDKTDLHLVFACNLLAKVLYLNLKGKRPSILATGAPVRDNLFEQTEAMISPRAEFGGCVPHSEMWMRKGSMLYFYGPDDLQEFSKTLSLVYSVTSVTASVNSRAAEKWTLLEEMSPEEYAAFKTLVDEAMRANREKGGEESGRLLLLAKDMEKENWNEAELSPEMKEEFARFLRKEKYSGDGGRDLLIENMKSKRMIWEKRKLLVPLRHAFWETARENKIDAVVSEEVRDLLPPEHRAEFNRLSREQYGNDEGLLLHKLDVLHAGWDAALDTAMERFREVRIPIWKSNWDTKFDELVEYKKKHGHCNVPIAHPQLGGWVQTQRQHYRLLQQGKGSMKEANVEMLGDRVGRLNGIGFVWNTRTETRRTEPRRDIETGVVLNVSDIVIPPLVRQGNLNSPSETSSTVIQPNEEDVLLGRGKSHPGNKRMRATAAIYRDLYAQAKREDKKGISAVVLVALQNANPPSRFLQKNAETGLYEVADDKKAVEKISSVMREKEKSAATANEASDVASGKAKRAKKARRQERVWTPALLNTSITSERVWTLEEDEAIGSMQAQHGNNWTTIAAELGTGRTSDEIKKRWGYLHRVGLVP